MPSGNFNRTFRYLEAVDQASGRASRMDFYNIAGNELNLRRWEQKLCNDWKLIVRSEVDGHEYYSKTELGEHLHKLLKSHEYVGSLFEELIRDRLRT